MKSARLITILFVFAIAFSVWTPTPVAARQADPGNHAGISLNVEPAATVGIAKLRITNKTGGTLYVRLVGVSNGRYYYSSVGNKSSAIIQVLQGKYTYTITTTACGGVVTKTSTFKGKTGSLGTWVCRH